MFSFKFHSMSEELYEPTDCRVIIADAHYTAVSRDAVIAAARKFYHFITKFQNDQFAGKWYFRGRNRADKNFEKLIEASQDSFDFWNEACVITKYIYNKKTFGEYMQHLQTDYRIQLLYDRPSEDYSKYLNQLLAARPKSREDLKASILTLFQETSKTNRNYYNACDMTSSFFCTQMAENKFTGSFEIKLAVSCVCGNAQKTAELFAAFLCEESIVLNDLSGLVGISPWPYIQNPYMTYFGAEMPGDVYQRRYSDYIPGVEWGNLIPEKICRQLPELKQQACQQDDMLYDGLENGAAFISLKKEVQTVHVRDLKPVKSLLYPVLVPGKREFLIADSFPPANDHFMLRRCWENVPVFDDELLISDKSIIFRHLSAGSV